MSAETRAQIEFFPSDTTVSLRTEPVARLFVDGHGYPNGPRGVMALLRDFKGRFDIFTALFGQLDVSPQLAAALFVKSGNVLPMAGNHPQTRFIYRVVIEGSRWLVSVYAPTFAPHRHGWLLGMDFLFSVTL